MPRGLHVHGTVSDDTLASGESGQFPCRRQLFTNTVGWLEAEVEESIATRVSRRGVTPNEATVIRPISSSQRATRLADNDPRS
jgi:hypothetical protein